MAEAKGIFEVKGWDEKTYEELPNGGKLSEAKVTQHFSGDIIGEGNVIWLMAYPSANTAHFVGIQRFVGTVGGKKGSFVAETIGDFDGKVAKWRCSILTGSGTDKLSGISGEGAFEAPHGSRAEYRIEYEFEPAKVRSGR
ncbi:MAG: DUF3224 domain-containing protein [Chloroflexi bacterium]|nr:MAG: DUF3224 domain-containing protein [Chloroflexota bacterium]TMC29585.1 MAG: DUF3224 domain-containing protein [Chloroflexota bacterium]TMC33643.1 MAG: DUF3224 domain-containing protein [Chloroflexota bacterium]TMC57940.1 MAG: DUF3224 domain-containing protein [Chloroflexota bacterium]TME38579.1 MAG: DUF3224 domain-containing protein [Chloroflexota bacterium]